MKILTFQLNNQYDDNCINITSPIGQAVGYFLGTINESGKRYLNYMIFKSLILGFGSLLLLFPQIFFSAK
jgi:hypothetical protein